MIALFGLVACLSPDKPADTAGVDTLTIAGLSAEVAIVPTVVWVRWETATPLRSDVTASFDGGEVVVAESAPATEHAVMLTGLPPLTTLDVRVTADGTGDVAETRVTTGAHPAWVPDLDYAADAPASAEGGVTLAPVILPGGGGILGIDAAGTVVWSWPQDDAGFPWPPFRAWLARDGQAVLYNHMAPSAEDPGPIVRVSLDGSAVENRAITGGHTDFVEYTPGGHLSLGSDIREVDGRKLLGDTIRELAPDGTERVVWSAWDDFSPDLAKTYPNLYPADVTVEDWTHINGIAYDADEDDVYVTATFNNAVIRVDRATGELVWWVSDYQGGDFTNVDGAQLMTLPHSVQRVDGGITVFSRGNPADPEACSEVVDIALDEVTWEARERWSYTAPDCLLVPYLGGAERLPGGNTLVSWTTAGRLDEVTPDGALAWQVGTSIGAAFGFSTRAERLGP